MRKVDALLVSLQMLSMATLSALPKGAQTVHGSAQIDDSNSGQLEIHSQDGTIIHWDDFSIEKGELARFVQQSSKSAVFNRVVGNLRSDISGTLESNGHVFLMNPNGVTIHKEGVINTAGFLATSLDFDIQKFVKGEDTSFQGQGTVVNLGKVTASEGDIYLLGMQIDNQGSMHAPHGSTYMGAAQNIILKQTQDKGLYVVVTPSSIKNEGAALTHQGFIEAVQVQMKADGNPYTYAIQDDGVIEATGLETQEGYVVLTAESGPLIARGHISAINDSAVGGTIHLLGEDVRLLENAALDVSGPTGGGTVLVGGDYQGSNPDIRNSLLTALDTNVTIRANGLENGNGGRVIVWSDGPTAFLGSIEAKGGTLSGDGGFVEVSGKTNLIFKGPVNTTAPQGNTGMLLLDPTDIVIDGAPTTGGVVLGPTSTIPAVAIVDILNTDLTTQLGLTNVSISTATAGPNAGSMLISSPVVWATNNTLTLQANTVINVLALISNTSAVAPVVNPSISITSLTGDINIDAAALGALATSTGLATVNGDIFVSAPLGNINLVGGTIPDAPAFIGAISGNTTGNITVECGGQLTITGGTGGAPTVVYSYAGIGRFGSVLTAIGSSTAPYTTNINVGTDCILSGGNNTNNFSIIGLGANVFGGGWGGGVFDETLNLNVGRNLEMISGTLAGAVMGSIQAPHNSNMTINVGENLYMHNNPATGAFIGAQIGGATTNPDIFAWNENIFLTVGRNMTMDARSYAGLGAFTCLQPFNGSAGPITPGVMQVHVGGDLVMIAGSQSANQSYMLLHSELFSTEVWVGGNIRCFNGAFHDAAFPVPFTFNVGDLGNVDIRAGGNIVMGGGNRGPGFFDTQTYVSDQGSIYFQADAPFAPGQLWSVAPVPVGANPNIFTGTPLATTSTNTSTVSPFGTGGDGLGGFTLDTARYDMGLGLFPPTTVLGLAASITSPLPPPGSTVLSPATNAISYTATLGTLSILSSDRYADGSACDLLISPSFTAVPMLLANHVGVQSFGDMTIGNFRNITMDALAGSPGGPQTTGGGNILIIANNDMTMNANTSVIGTGTVTLVVDNQGPIPPQIGGVWSGGGRFIMDATAFITTPLPTALRIFTACQPLNTISGLLNGVPFAPGPLYIDTNTERWGVWYLFPGSGFFSPPDFYCLFYKCFNGEVVGQTTIPIQEFLIGLHGSNEYLGWLEQFDESYTDRKKRDKYVGTSYELANNEKYMIRMKYYRMNNPKSYTAN